MTEQRTDKSQKRMGKGLTVPDGRIHTESVFSGDSRKNGLEVCRGDQEVNSVD